ncbi:TRAP-type C4-dicarboxylate transport system, large permease component [hydrothermal vent metagenome]|uniref:TRAP-type C4-dicarboxylate transport system, large permease component n=1 Tax=hydrothermal vent metagenome TaxID=652676 RepID=A0A3B0XB26_9ZZZZ
MVGAMLLIVLVILGAPLFAIIATSALIGFYGEGIDLSVIAIEIYRIVDTPVLLAIPLFTFAGYVLGESNASKRLVRVTNAMLGWMPGGLAVVSLFACAFFTALTGASGATIIALGAILYPAMKQAGYAERFNLGLITSSGSLGLLFPPSIALILYGVIAQQMDLEQPVAIDDLFVAGLLPGLLMLALLIAWSMYKSVGDKIPTTDFDARELFSALRESMWEIPLPILLIGGIYGGYIAVSEAAAVAVLYVLVVDVLILREIKIKQLPSIMRESMVLVGGVLIILSVSLASTNYLIDAEIPTKLFDFIQAHIDSKLTFLMLLNIFLLVLGMMLDIFSALVIIVPLTLPIAVGYGIHPIHFGIIFLANMQIGYFTPPVGMNLFIASYRFNKPITELYYATIPFMLILFVAVLIITYWPALTMSLLEIKHN